MQIMNVRMIRLTAEYGKRRDILNIAQMFDGLSTQCFLGFQKLCPAFAIAYQSKRGCEHPCIYTYKVKQARTRLSVMQDINVQVSYSGSDVQLVAYTT